MDLNTITEVVAAATARDELPAWTRRRCLARAAAPGCSRSRRPHLTRLIDLTDLGWPALTIDGRRTGHRRHLHRRATRRVRLPADLGRRAADRPMLPRLSRLVQDLEHGDRRRQYLHVAAGRADDLADRRARWRLHDLERRTAASGRCRSSISSPATQTQRAQTPGESAAPDRYAVGGADAPRRVPPDLADAASAAPAALLIGTLAQRWRVRADGDGLDGAAGAAVAFAALPDDRRTASAHRRRNRAPMAVSRRHPRQARLARHMTLRLAEEIRDELAERAR